MGGQSVEQLGVGQNPWLRNIPGKQFAMIDTLFDRFSVMFGARWASRFRDDAQVEAWRAEWSAALSAERVTGRAVRSALNRCRRLEWPPTLAEFLLLASAVPDFEGAFFEAQRNMTALSFGEQVTWSHAAVYWAAQGYGGFELRNTAYAQAKRRWEKLLGEQLARSFIPPVPAPAAALPAPGRITNRETGRRHLQQIKTMLREGRSDRTA